MWLAVRNLGVGLCMMPIMTAGVSALPRALTSVGSSVNNVMQRVSSSIAIAVFGSLNAAKGAQLMSDQSGLAGADNPAAAEGGSVTELLGRYQVLAKAITTETYANGFYVVAILGVIGMVLALFLRSGSQKAGAGTVPWSCSRAERPLSS